MFPGIEADHLNALRLIRGDSVDYWHGEGSGPVPSATVTREPEHAPGPATVNIQHLDLERDEGRRCTSLGDIVGAERLDAAVLELGPGADFGPYCYEYGREQWLLVIAGTATVQNVNAEHALSYRDLACLPDGPAAGRRLLNPSRESTRMLLLWTAGFPTVACYPETGDWILCAAHGDEGIHLRNG